MSKTDLMKSYVPDYLKEAQPYKAILEGEGLELGSIETDLADVLEQLYVETATEEGLIRWEEFVGLSSYAGKPLDQRRSRIIAKLRGMGTATAQLIQNIVESYVYSHVTVNEHPETYSFTIKFVDLYGVPPNLGDLKAAIEDIKPAHLAVIYEILLNLYLKFMGQIDKTQIMTYEQLEPYSYDKVDGIKTIGQIEGLIGAWRHDQMAVYMYNVIREAPGIEPS